MALPRVPPGTYTFNIEDLGPDALAVMYGGTITTEGRKMALSREQLKAAQEAALRQLAATEAELKKYEAYPSDGEFTNLVRFTIVRKHVRKGQMNIAVDPSRVHYQETVPDFPYEAYGDHRRVSFGQLQRKLSIEGAFVASQGKDEVEEREYQYVAFRVDDKWFLTGTKSRKAMSHEEFVQYLIDHDVTTLEFFNEPSQVFTVGEKAEQAGEDDKA